MREKVTASRMSPRPGRVRYQSAALRRTSGRRPLHAGPIDATFFASPIGPALAGERLEMETQSMPRNGTTLAEWAVIERLQRAIAGALRGKPDVIQLALTALLARGHLLV